MRFVPPGPINSLAPLLALAALVLALGVTLAIPTLDGDVAVERPPHPTIVAALAQARTETVTGRIIGIQPAGVVLRVLIGIRRVATLHRTVYTGSSGAGLDPHLLRRGDSVRVTGHRVGAVLLATSMRDLSRR